MQNAKLEQTCNVNSVKICQTKRQRESCMDTELKEKVKRQKDKMCKGKNEMEKERERP